MEKRGIGYIPGKGDPLAKKVPKNPKYDKVEATIDTGYTVKHIEVVSNQAIAKRKGELFSRIKASTVANLLKQDQNTESIYAVQADADGEGYGEGYPEEMKSHYGEIPDNQSVYSMRSHMTQKSDISRVSAITYATEQLGINDNTEFLLLYLREPDDYELFHIKESINFPGPNILRDKSLPEFYRFKNKPDKLIIVYHSDERNSIPFATQFFEKGYENVYLISGGAEDFLRDHPELVEGKKVPVIAPKKEKKVLLKSSNYRENVRTGGDVKFTEKGPSASIVGGEVDPKTSTKTSNMSRISKKTTKTTTTTKKPM